jgi:hypothetical protein
MDKLMDVVEESQSAKEKKWKQVTGGLDLRGNTARYRIRLPQLKGAKEEEREGETPIKVAVDQERGG